VTKKNVEVKAGGKTIATIDVEVFDSIEEAVESLGDADVLSMINRQRQSNLCNRVRARSAADSPAKQISALARAAKRGEIPQSEAKRKIEELLPLLS